MEANIMDLLKLRVGGEVVAVVAAEEGEAEERGEVVVVVGEVEVLEEIKEEEVAEGAINCSKCCE